LLKIEKRRRIEGLGGEGLEEEANKIAFRDANRSVKAGEKEKICDLIRERICSNRVSHRSLLIIDEIGKGELGLINRLKKHNVYSAIWS
jgi:hypothetical protein